MAELWMDIELWLNASFVPVWAVCIVFILYFAVKLWYELRLPPP